jgi:hypothetical protein
MLVGANVATIVRLRALMKVERSSIWLGTEVAGSLAVLALVCIPWALGGLDPTREDLTWAILLSFATGFLSVGALVLSIFDIVR